MVRCCGGVSFFTRHLWNFLRDSPSRFTHWVKRKTKAKPTILLRQTAILSTQLLNLGSIILRKLYLSKIRQVLKIVPHNNLILMVSCI